jgi:hypothetical protein
MMAFHRTGSAADMKVLADSLPEDLNRSYGKPLFFPLPHPPAPELSIRYGCAAAGHCIPLAFQMVGPELRGFPQLSREARMAQDTGGDTPHPLQL